MSTHKFYEWSKPVFEYTGCKVPSHTKKSGFPFSIKSSNGTHDIEIKAHVNSMTIFITTNGSVVHSKYCKDILFFEIFAKELICSLCCVFGGIKDDRVRILLSEEHIKELETLGYFIGNYISF